MTPCPLSGLSTTHTDRGVEAMRADKVTDIVKGIAFLAPVSGFMTGIGLVVDCSITAQ